MGAEEHTKAVNVFFSRRGILSSESDVGHTCKSFNVDLFDSHAPWIPSHFVCDAPSLKSIDLAAHERNATKSGSMTIFLGDDGKPALVPLESDQTHCVMWLVKSTPAPALHSWVLLPFPGFVLSLASPVAPPRWGGIASSLLRRSSAPLPTLVVMHCRRSPPSSAPFICL